MGSEHPLPPQHSAAAQPEPASMSRKPSMSLSTGSRAPSLLAAAQNLSTNSLSSLASGSAAAANARSPSPASEYVGSRTDVGEGESEAQRLRRQMHQMETRHEEELRRRSTDHDANVAAVQAQAVAKMKELIEKVGHEPPRPTLHTESYCYPAVHAVTVCYCSVVCPSYCSNLEINAKLQRLAECCCTVKSYASWPP